MRYTWRYQARAELILRVSRKLRRIFIGDLQAKATGLFEVRAQLTGPAAFALAMLVSFFDAGRMKLVDDSVEVVIGYRESEVAAAVGVFGHFTQFVCLIKNHALTGGHGDGSHPVLLLLYCAIQKTLVEIHTGVQVRRIEVKMMDFGLFNSLCFRDLEEITFAILKDEAVIPTTT